MTRFDTMRVLRHGIKPSVDSGGTPWCDTDCPQHDGKRCGVLGCRPSAICEPGVQDMAAAIGARP